MNIYLKARTIFDNLILCIMIFIVSILYSEKITNVTYKGIFKISLIIFISTYFVVSLIIIVHKLVRHNQYEQEDTFKSLQTYIWSKNENVTLIIEKDKEKNGQAIKGKYIILTDKWYEYAKQNGTAYVEATLSHELYHINENKSFFDWKSFNLLNPIKSIREKEYIREWLEEFKADRYGYELFENKDDFLGHMLVMQEQREIMDAKKSRRRKKVLSDHPTWEMRLRFIKDDIIPTWENVSKEYYHYYKK